MTAPHSGGSFGHSEDEEENPTVGSSGESSSSIGEDEEGYSVAKSNNGSSSSDDKETEEHLPHILSEESSEVAKICKNLKSTMKSLKKVDRRKIKELLTEFLRHPEDVETMSQILSKAQSDSLYEDNDTVDELFLLKDIARSILEFVGVQTVDGRILYEMEVTPKLNAVASMIEDILKLKLKEGDLNKIFPSK